MKEIYVFDAIWMRVHTVGVAWDVELTDLCLGWWESLTLSEQESVGHSIDLLAEFGPALSRPYADTLKNSQFPNMKELRAQYEGRPYRMLFAFDPRRTALILFGGDKTGDSRWYEKAIPIADELYARHLKELSDSNVSTSRREQS